MNKPCMVLLVSLLFLSAAPAWAQLYDIKQATATHDRRQVDALRVQVDGNAESTRSFLQDFMKDSYNIRFKSKALAALGVGKKDELSAQQVSAISVSSRPVDLYVSLSALTDSTTEVAFFGGFGDKTFFDPGSTAHEFTGLRTILEKFAPAARANAYRQQVKEAEDNAAAIDKQKAKLEHSMQSARNNTTSNLKRIDELTRQNHSNALQVSQDSTQLLSNGQLAEAARLHLQRRRERLNTVAPK